jgi:hypothetical protein
MTAALATYQPRAAEREVRQLSIVNSKIAGFALGEPRGAERVPRDMAPAIQCGPPGVKGGTAAGHGKPRGR